MYGLMRPKTSVGIGPAVRKLRLAKGLTLAELSNQSGVPISTLSRVELGETALKYDKLVRLCQVLDVDLQGLVAREAEAVVPASGRRAVTRAGQGDVARVAGHTGRRAATDLLSKSFTPMVLTLSATSLAEHGPLRATGGEAYVLILSGAAVLHSPLYAPLALSVGDEVYFDGQSGFALLAATAAASTALLVLAGDETTDD